MPPREWLTRLQDILESIEAIHQYVNGMEYEDFVQDERTQHAVVWNIAVIGEAARLVPDDIEIRYSEIPWSSIRGMRNILVHEYFGIDAGIVWQTAVSNLPALDTQLRKIIAEHESDRSDSIHESE